MAASIRQVKFAEGTPGSTTIAATFDSNPLAGSTILALVTNLDDAGANQPTVTVADGVNGSYPAAIDNIRDTANNQRTRMFCKQNVSAGATTVTATYSASISFRGIVIIEVAGVAVASQDQHTAQMQLTPGTGTDATTSGNTGTLGGVPNIVVGVTWNSGGSPGTPATGTGYTSAGTGWQYGGGNDLTRVESKLTSATTAVAATFTANGNTAHQTFVVVLLELLQISPTGIASAEAFGSTQVLFLADDTGGWVIGGDNYVGEAMVGAFDNNGTTLSPGGIASAEAFGSATVTPGAVTVSPGGIATLEAFGTSQLNLNIAGTGIATAEAFGTATVTPGAVTVSPAGIATAEAFGSTTVTPGGVTVSPASIASSEAFGTAQLDLSISTTGIATAEAFGSSTLTPGAVTVSPSSVTTLEAFGSATVTPGAVTISPSGVATAEAFGNATVDVGAATLSPAGIATAEAFGSTTITTGEVTVSPAGIATAEAFGTSTLTPGAVTVSPSSISTTEAFGTATVSVGGVTISPSAIATAEAFGTATVAVGNITISPASIASAEAFGGHVIALQLQFISPGGIASAQSFGNASVTLPSTTPLTVTNASALRADLIASLTSSTLTFVSRPYLANSTNNLWLVTKVVSQVVARHSALGFSTRFETNTRARVKVRHDRGVVNVVFDIVGDKMRLSA
jgi:hypothetical protein